MHPGGNITEAYAAYLWVGYALVKLIDILRQGAQSLLDGHGGGELPFEVW